MSSDNGLLSLDIDQVLVMIFNSFNQALKGAVSFFTTLLGICILTIGMSLIAFDERKSKFLEISILSMFAALIFSYIRPMIYSIRDALCSLLDFTELLTPILSGVMLAYGNHNSAISGALGMNIVTTLIAFISKSLLLPLSFLQFSFAMISPISENEATRISKWIKNVFVSVFAILSTLLFSSLAVQNVMASSLDGIYLKTAKQALSGMIPVVGSTISASLSSLMGAFTYVKGTVGTLSIAFILSLFLPIFFALLFLRFAISFSSTFMDFASIGAGVRLFNSFLAGVDTLMSIFVLSFLSSFFALVFFMKGGAQVFG